MSEGGSDKQDKGAADTLSHLSQVTHEKFQEVYQKIAAEREAESEFLAIRPFTVSHPR